MAHSSGPTPPHDRAPDWLQSLIVFAVAMAALSAAFAQSMTGGGA